MWATEWKETSFWLDGMAPISGVSTSIKPDVDVLIIGSDYTGLHAALQTARAGKEVLVVEKGYPGYGCSTRNGGQISTSVRLVTAAHKKAFSDPSMLLPISWGQS